MKRTAISYALFLLSRRAYFKKDIRAKLLTKEYTPEEVDQAIIYLESNKYLNDEYLASSKGSGLQFKKGNRFITQKLNEKGISDDVKSLVLSTLTEEHLRLKEMILKKYKLIKKEDLQKIVAFYLRRGFSYGEIKKALKEFPTLDSVEDLDDNTD